MVADKESDQKQLTEQKQFSEKEQFAAECRKLVELCIADLKTKSYSELCRLDAFTDDDFAIGDRKVSLMTSMEISKTKEVMVAVEVSWQTKSFINMGVTAWADGFAMNSEGVGRELTEEEYWALQ